MPLHRIRVNTAMNDPAARDSRATETGRSVSPSPDRLETDPDTQRLAAALGKLWAWKQTAPKNQAAPLQMPTPSPQEPLLNARRNKTQD